MCYMTHTVLSESLSDYKPPCSEFFSKFGFWHLADFFCTYHFGHLHILHSIRGENMALSLTHGQTCASGSARSSPRLHHCAAPQQQSLRSFCGLKSTGCSSPSFRSCSAALSQRQTGPTRAARGLACATVCKSQFKVALLGAAGGIGQPLALLLKMNRYVSDLSLYDIVNVPGVAADLSHCNTPTQVGDNSTFTAL